MIEFNQYDSMRYFFKQSLKALILLQFLSTSGRAFHNFTPQIERHIAFWFVRTCDMINVL